MNCKKSNSPTNNLKWWDSYGMRSVNLFVCISICALCLQDAYTSFQVSD